MSEGASTSDRATASGTSRSVLVTLGMVCLLLVVVLVYIARTETRGRTYHPNTRGFEIKLRDDESWSVARKASPDKVAKDLWHGWVYPWPGRARTFELPRGVNHSIDWLTRDGRAPIALSPKQGAALRAEIVAVLDRDDVKVDPRWRSRFLAGEGVTSVVRWQGYAEYGIVIGLVGASLGFFWRAMAKRTA